MMTRIQKLLANKISIPVKILDKSNSTEVVIKTVESINRSAELPPKVIVKFVGEPDNTYILSVEQLTEIVKYNLNKGEHNEINSNIYR